MYFEHPIPFHVAYPFSSFYQDEQTAEKDLEMMKSFYPELSRQIQKLIERECDRMEYDGSMMYDEYPDPFMISLTCKRILDQVENMPEEDQEKIQAQSGGAPLDELVRVLFCHEVFRRRCRHRRGRRYF